MDSENVADGIIRVSGKVNPNSLASVVARSIVSGQGDKIRLRAIGAGPANQASKACAIARSFVAQRGIDLYWKIGFEDVEGDSGKQISALVWIPVIR